ncbi:MAG TPA: hypothetical protein VN578_00910 [Candidatus Binatia bacterium]|jgi:hypothetical protein|nr:hypothetical protein [Candidatus Binatia bacterium]
MNPFVNPKKRSILLPSGCKDLADVLRLPTPKSGDPIQTFIRTMLLRAEECRASEMVVGTTMVHEGECSVTQRIAFTWHHVSTIPSGFRSRVVEELLRMAALHAGQFPSEGPLYVQLKRRQLKWNVQMAGPDAECVLTPLGGPRQSRRFSRRYAKRDVPEVYLPSRVVVKELATALGAKLYSVISILKQMEVFSSVHQKISFFDAARVAKRYGYSAKRKGY